MGLLQLFRKNKVNSTQLKKITDFFNELRRGRVSLVIEYEGSSEYYYGIVTSVNSELGQIELIDLTPESNIASWHRKGKMSISTAPLKGEHYKFETTFHSLLDVEKKYYLIHYPDCIKSVELRTIPRIKIAKSDDVSLFIHAENPVSKSSEFLKSVLPESYKFTGYVVDLSQAGMQIILDGDNTDILHTGASVITDIMWNKLSANIEFKYKISWALYDKEENVTRLGGQFACTTEKNKKMLAYFISRVQSSMYHNYV